MLQTQTTARARSMRRPTTTCADSKRRNPFRKYGTEKEQTVRTPKVVEDETLRQLMDRFRSFRSSYHTASNLEEHYQEAVEAIRGIEYTAEDVEKFSVALDDFPDDRCIYENLGYFLSALVNEGSDRDYTIHTRHWAKLPDILGYKNTKNLTIEGDVGDFLGYLMQEGKILLKGTARDLIGSNMIGGEIHIEGDIISFISDKIEGGRIYHKGRLIVENGTILDPKYSCS